MTASQPAAGTPTRSRARHGHARGRLRPYADSDSAATPSAALRRLSCQCHAVGGPPAALGITDSGRLGRRLLQWPSWALPSRWRQPESVTRRPRASELREPPSGRRRRLTCDSDTAGAARNSQLVGLTTGAAPPARAAPTLQIECRTGAAASPASGCCWQSESICRWDSRDRPDCPHPTLSLKPSGWRQRGSLCRLVNLVLSELSRRLRRPYRSST